MVVDYVGQWWGEPLFEPFRYKVLFGGRGSGKSFAIADALLMIGAKRTCRVLCAREFQSSIAESVHHLLERRINELGLSSFYRVQRDLIVAPGNKTEFIFKGVHNNIESIKSLSGVTHLWLEEAQTISKRSWDVLIPTIREPGSEIWVSFNPQLSDDPTYKMFVTSHPGADAYVQEINFTENPHFPEELERERQRLLANDIAAHDHVYGGQPLTSSDAQIYNGKWRVEEFTAGGYDWSGPHFGLDFGFSQDPTAAVRCWVFQDCLWIDYEAGKRGLELNDTTAFLTERIPDFADHVIRADSARPESISYLTHHGLPRIEGVEKWAGSVQDGITAIRAFKSIVVHPRCVETQRELKLYSYKVDRLTGDVLRTIVDANQHYLDAVRYALAPYIQSQFTDYGSIL